MLWLALHGPEGWDPHARQAMVWRALRLTPRVTQIDEALVLEVSSVLRLWGGPQRLLRRLLLSNRQNPHIQHAWGATLFVALALLRLKCRDQPPPPICPDGLPLDTLTAARPHLQRLNRLGCRTWGDLRRLPRDGMARRFGPDLLHALDVAWGLQPQACTWLTLPEVFDQQLELPAPVSQAPELLWALQRLLGPLRSWLCARQLGVLALQLQWTYALHRLDGMELPPTGELVVRTAQACLGLTHVRRLLAEQLAHTVLAAPVQSLRLTTVQTADWIAQSDELLAQPGRQSGESLHELLERLTARLGPDRVLRPVLQADHRPERMQRWEVLASEPTASRAQPLTVHHSSFQSRAGQTDDALWPAWLLREPLPLRVHQGVVQYFGPLKRLGRAHRIEAGWWDDAQPVRRDYFLAHSPGAGLVWIFRELTSPENPQAPVRWFLHGLYA